MAGLRHFIQNSLERLRSLGTVQKRLLVGVFIVLILGIWFAISQIANPGGQSGSGSTDSESAVNRYGVQDSYSRMYYVSPTGSDDNDGATADKPLQSIDKALSFAAAGDTVTLADGVYDQTVSSVKDGSSEAPITIMGSRKAVVRGTDDFGRIVEVRHSYITLQGFTIDGKHGQGDSQDDYRDKLLYVIGQKAKQGVEGLKVDRMLIQNAGGECVRLRYFARNNEISNSEVRNCGVHDFKFDGGAKNGEGIYIGTAPEQRADGKNPTDDPDVSMGNVVRNNVIETYGNECVDVKEAATANVIEYNTCRHQQDPESAGYDARGSGNIFRYNTASDNVGAGFRLGGDEEQDGINNEVYDNVITNNRGGAVKVMRQPQGRICGNKLENNSNKSGEYEVEPDQTCGN